MDDQLNDIIQGRKTFFITPDSLVLPYSYLEEYLSLGYECYYIENDKTLPIETKVDIILTLFKDSIVFFCIDTMGIDINWYKFIPAVQKKYGDSAKLGVLFNKRKNDEEKHKLEKYFLFDVGLQCGCIQLEYQRRNNFELIDRVLFANQARGRRKSVRAICTHDCNFTMTQKGARITGKLNDISATHFSITLSKGQISTKLYEKVSEILFYVNGCYFRNDAVLYMTRETDSGILYIFMFVSKDGKQGLDLRNHQLLLPKLYGLLSENCMGILSDLYKKAKKELELQNRTEE